MDFVLSLCQQMQWHVTLMGTAPSYLEILGRGRRLIWQMQELVDWYKQYQQQPFLSNQTQFASN